MNELAMKIKQPKRRGEWVELRFMAAAAENGFHVTKPWGDSAQYDFIVENQGGSGAYRSSPHNSLIEAAILAPSKEPIGPIQKTPSTFSPCTSFPRIFGTSFPNPSFAVMPAWPFVQRWRSSKYSKYLGAWQLMKNDLECSTQ